MIKFKIFSVSQARTEGGGGMRRVRSHPPTHRQKGPLSEGFFFRYR